MLMHVGLIAAFKKSHNILNSRLPFLSHHHLNEDNTMLQL